MNKELIIRSGSDNVDFALLKDGRLIELQRDEDNNKFAVGDVSIAKIKSRHYGQKDHERRSRKSEEPKGRCYFHTVNSSFKKKVIFEAR